MISFLLLAVPLGMLVDRVGARNVLLVSLISKVVIVAVTFALYAAGLLTTIGMMVIATVMGVVVVATENAQTTTAPSVALDRDDTLQVVARMASADRIAGIVSPAVAGLLIALYGGLPVFGLAGALLILAAAAHVIFVVFEVLWAVTLTVTNIAGSAYTAAAVNPQSLGRASAASRTITMGSVPIAALAGGILADTAGMPVPLSIWPALTLVAAVSFVVLTRGDAG